MRERSLTPPATIGAVLLSLGIAACGTSSGATDHPTVTRPAAVAAHYQRPPAGIATVQLFAPMARYSQYVAARLATLRPQLAALGAAIGAGRLSAARSAWLRAHLTWLEIGQDDGQYGAFGTLGGEIDGLADGDVGGTASARFSGFHRVEFDLFHRDDLSAAAGDAAELTRLVDRITPRLLGEDLALSTTSLDAWVLRAHEILEDALRDSLSQDDDYGSNSDLATLRADVVATREMLAVLGGLIAPRAPGLLGSAESQLDAVDAALAGIPAGTEPSALAPRARQRLNGDVGGALETLAPISELMQISNANT